MRFEMKKKTYKIDFTIHAKYIRALLEFCDFQEIAKLRKYLYKRDRRFIKFVEDNIELLETTFVEIDGSKINHIEFDWNDENEVEFVYRLIKESPLYRNLIDDPLTLELFVALKKNMEDDKDETKK